MIRPRSHPSPSGKIRGGVGGWGGRGLGEAGEKEMLEWKHGWILPVRSGPLPLISRRHEWKAPNRQSLIASFWARKGKTFHRSAVGRSVGSRELYAELKQEMNHMQSKTFAHNSNTHRSLNVQPPSLLHYPFTRHPIPTPTIIKNVVLRRGDLECTVLLFLRLEFSECVTFYQ